MHQSIYIDKLSCRQWSFSGPRWTPSREENKLFRASSRQFDAILHRKKRFTSFPSPAGMSLTKLPLGRNNLVMTSLFPPRESLVVTSRLGTGNSRTFFYGVTGWVIKSYRTNSAFFAYSEGAPTVVLNSVGVLGLAISDKKIIPWKKE